MPFIQTSLAQNESAKPNAVCVQYAALSCFLSAKQMAKSNLRAVNGAYKRRPEA
jgi:hypothetical protein